MFGRLDTLKYFLNLIPISANDRQEILVRLATDYTGTINETMKENIVEFIQPVLEIIGNFSTIIESAEISDYSANRLVILLYFKLYVRHYAQTIINLYDNEDDEDKNEDENEDKEDIVAALQPYMND